jgi:hypothetical protein
MKRFSQVCSFVFPAVFALALNVQPTQAFSLSPDSAESSKLVAFGSPNIGGFPEKIMNSVACKKNLVPCYVIKQQVLTQGEWDNEVEAKIKGNRNPITKRLAVQRFCASRYGKDFHSITLLGRAACNYKEVYIPPGFLL